MNDPTPTPADPAPSAGSDAPPPVECRVTFGAQYARRVEHPTVLPDGRRPHPDGWVSILLPAGGDAEDARPVALRLFGQQWCDLVPARSPHGSWGMYPLGCLATFDARTDRWVGAR